MTGPELTELARDIIARARRDQGLPPTITNPAALDRLAALLDAEPIPEPASARARKRGAA